MRAQLSLHWSAPCLSRGLVLDAPGIEVSLGPLRKLPNFFTAAQRCRLLNVIGNRQASGPGLTQGRRGFVKKSLVASGIAWTAPIVLSMNEPVAAATGSGGCPFTFCFDDGTTEGWTIDNSAGSGDGLWQVNNGRSTSPTFSLHYGNGVGGTYNTNGINSGTVTSPSIDVPAAGGDLTFNILRDVEFFATGFWDRFSVTILPTNTTIYTTGPDGGTGGVFEPVSLDLGAFAGTTIQIVFAFDTLDANFNDHEGIWIDDVTVPCNLPPATSAIALAPAVSTALAPAFPEILALSTRDSNEAFFPEFDDPTARELRDRRRATR